MRCSAYEASVIRSPPLAARSSLGRECGSSARLKCHACPPGPRAGSRIASAVAASSGASSPTSGVYCTIGRRLCRRATWTDTQAGTGETRTRTSMARERGIALHSAGPGAATNNLDGDGVLRDRRQPAAFTAQCETRVATWVKNSLAVCVKGVLAEGGRRVSRNSSLSPPPRCSLFLLGRPA